MPFRPIYHAPRHRSWEGTDTLTAPVPISNDTARSGAQSACETCRVLMSRGITGPFETWKPSVPYACMRDDVERTAELTVEEGKAKSPRFRRWEPYSHAQDAISRARGSASAREDDAAGRVVVAPDTIARSCEEERKLLAEVAE